MPSFPFLQIDAFTDHPLGGNPCAVILDADPLASKTMQAIALEMNLSETAFVLRSERADFGARYFTPAEEIPMAGHPTIATVFALVDAGRATLTPPLTTITLELPAGIIPIEIHSQKERVDKIVMTQPEPRFLNTYPPEDVLPAFGLDPADALPGYPIQTVSTGTPQLMVPVRDHEVLRRAYLDIQTYRSLKENGDFFSPHLFCLGGVTPSGDTFARHFGMPPDTLEDPFTGSATGGMAAYLWRYGLISNTRFTAEQGHWMGRPGKAEVEVIESNGQIEAVKVGGSAALIIRGQLTL